MPDSIKTAPTFIDFQIATGIRRWREALGISQEAVGRAVGLSSVQISKYECAVNRIPAATLFLIARFLNLPLDQLFMCIEPEEGPDAKPKQTRNPNRQVSLDLAYEAVMLASLFERITDPVKRNKALRLVRAMATTPATPSEGPGAGSRQSSKR